MKILMILIDNTFPPDIRVRKEARTLVDAGHEVYVLAKRGPGQPLREMVNGIKVYRFGTPHLEGFSKFIFYLVIRIILPFYLLFFSLKHKVDVFHAHDLLPALPTCLAGRVLGKPVIFDMHEDYPSMIEATISEFPSIVRPFLILASKFFRLEEKLAVKFADKVITIVEEEAERLRRMGISREKIEVIYNVEILDEIEELVKKLGNRGRPSFLRDKFIISYVGGFEVHRGLKTLIKAMPFILKDIKNAHLLLVGDGVIKDELMNLCKDLGLEEFVTFTGWVRFEEAMYYILISDVCVIPYDKTKLTEKSFPHKLAQYMVMGKPVVVSDCKSLKRIINSAKCGLIFKAGDPRDLAEKIIQLGRDRELRILLGRNAKRAALEKYNWANMGVKLIRMYGEIAGR
ncbi:MAG: glycosyltransferase family 4 protein [Candidatus Njordarchaeales archaeon]